MWSACGTSPSGAFASSAARWRTPKRCCSSTTTTARSRNSTGVLDQRVRAHHQLELPIREPVEQLAAPGRARGAGQELHRQRAPEQRVERAVVLLGERLRGRHQRGLGAVLDGAQHRGQGAHRLARSHLPHQQPLHRLLAGEVGVDLLDRALLVTGELERERPAPAVHHHAARLQRPRAPSLAPGAPASRHGELEQEQLLEGEPPPGVALVLLADGEVNRLDRRRPLGELVLDAQPGGQRLDHREHARARLAHELSQARRTDALRGGVHRHEPEGVHGCLPVADQLMLGDPELVALAQLAVQQHHRPLAELARDPGLVEPHGHERARLVEHARLHALLAPVAHGLHRGAAHGDRDGGLLADHQIGHPAHVAPVAVRMRQVLHQIAPGPDLERLETLDGLREDARPGIRPDRRRAQLAGAQLVLGCEVNRHGTPMMAAAPGVTPRRGATTRRAGRPRGTRPPPRPARAPPRRPGRAVASRRRCR